MPTAPGAGDLTMPAETYTVYVRIPTDWWEQQTVIEEVARILHAPRGSVRRRIDWLILAKLVERRTRQTIQPAIEIRRIGK